MMRRGHVHASRTALFTFILITSASLVFSQEAITVRIRPFEARGASDVAEQLATTVEQTISLSLRLLQGITVLDGEEHEEATVVIRGEVVDGDEYNIALSLDDQRLPGEVQELTVSTDSLLEVFDLADQLTADAVSRISRRDIAFGSLILEAEGSGDWEVVLGGERFDGSPTNFYRLPAESYSLSVQQRQGPETVTLVDEEVTVVSGETTRVSFELPDPVVVARRVLRESELDYLRVSIRGAAEGGASRGSTTAGSTTAVSSESEIPALLGYLREAAAQLGVGELYEPRLEAWRPADESGPEGATTDEPGPAAGLTVPEARARLSGYVGGELSEDPRPANLIGESVDVFEDQLAAWSEELGL